MDHNQSNTHSIEYKKIFTIVEVLALRDVLKFAKIKDYVCVERDFKIIIDFILDKCMTYWQ